MKILYRSNTYIPDLVQVSKSLAEKNEFTNFCTDEVGRLLAVLVGQIKVGKILEIGTGFGVGSSWILSAINPSVHFLSVDNCIDKITQTSQNIHHKQGEFVYGDWKEIRNRGPFQFIFVDAAIAKEVEGEKVIDMLDIGGMIFMDDFTPEEHWPEAWKGKPDHVREFWLNHSGVLATEIYLNPKSSAITATRIK